MLQTDFITVTKRAQAQAEATLHHLCQGNGAFTQLFYVHALTVFTRDYENCLQLSVLFE